MGNGNSLHNELIHTPLIIKFPSSSNLPKGLIIDKNVASIDIFPTIGEVCKLNHDHMMLGTSLVGLIEGKDNSFDERVIFRELNYPRSVEAIYKKYKLIVSHSKNRKKWIYELYNLNIDKAETRNIYDQNPQIASFLNDQIAQYKDQCDTVLKIDIDSNADIQQLKAIGYIK